MLDAYDKGVLPRSGGWWEQDTLDIELIVLAGEVRGERERINRQKAKLKRPGKK